MQKPFLIKGKTDKFPRQNELRGVSYKTITKIVGTIDSPFGKINHIKATGRVDKSQLELWTDGYSYTIPATRDGIKTTIRRLREQEAALLDMLDKKIRDLRDERALVLKTAWSKANVITVKELVDRIEVK